MVNKISFIAFFILSIYITVPGQNILVKASVESSEYQVGDFITYTITVNHPNNINITIPTFKDSLKGVELLKSEPVVNQEKGGNTVSTYNYIISKYDSGDVHIPSIPVIYQQKGNQGKESILTNPVFFLVRTLNVNPQDDIKDVKGPIKIPLDWKIILLYILIGLVIIAAGVYGYLYYKKKRAQRLGIIEEIIREPEEVALEALFLLEDKKLWQQGFVKQYHSEITEIIRRYFEGRFKVPALEITTYELLTELEKVPKAKHIINITTDFLNNADLVKFAKFVPMSKVNEEMMKQAYEIVNTTIPLTEQEEKPQVIQEVLDVH
jgi:hypothetical protein